jgi:D-alanyl-D-alanine carboxypeptidase
VTADFTATLRELCAELGVPDDYGADPPLPVYAECRETIEVGPNIVGRVQRLEPSTALAWQRMLASALSDGVSLLLVSGFRSFDYQAELIRNKLNAGQRIDVILEVNVAPGYSQHHTGRAVDIATPGTRPLQEEFDRSDAFAWLTENAAGFGFSMSYPRDNPLGIIYEPWHWYRDPVS